MPRPQLGIPPNVHLPFAPVNYQKMLRNLPRFLNDYMPPSSKHPTEVLKNKKLAYISRYATGRDYHKLIRQRLKKLAKVREIYLKMSI